MLLVKKYPQKKGCEKNEDFKSIVQDWEKNNSKVVTWMARPIGWRFLVLLFKIMWKLWFKNVVKTHD